jgi:uncharacterized protein with HEPN domain
MLDAAQEAVSFVEGKIRNDLDTDRKLNLSLVRLIEVLGEAAGRVSREFAKTHTQITWGVIVGMRNRLAHGYDDVDLDIVWLVVKVELPPLIEQLAEILSTEGSGA